ncbi:flavin reductase family protein [Niveibacterium umoris]|uniref:Flavin reductase (DIM6/NTAB) family NADH-FMN oxidoreductase RutF n=1 Tax=Niveibacterium umoris TaxID=1193620 RepID=A0A840BNW0_9RHOO|nr:flavin reductase family protein [Niveibacterium umoris]MBB4014680.1 flavin reductase (DIM6/NTAB) family NADH-FMN oxidoreductase RutF [Niveibacterium umoris]
MRTPVELAKAYRLLNHGPVTLVSSAHGERRNLMAAAWSMPLDFSPPKVAVVIDKSTFTRELVEASGAFVLNIPSRAIAAQVIAAGGCSGREGDKFDALGIGALAADVLAAPLVAGCVGWLECRVIPEPHNQQAYDLFLGEVVAASADARVFSNGRWHFDEADPALRTLHYVAGGQFYVSGESLNV